MKYVSPPAGLTMSHSCDVEVPGPSAAVPVAEAVEASHLDPPRRIRVSEEMRSAPLIHVISGVFGYVAHVSTKT